MKLVREILQSEKGKEMWSSVAPIYNNDAYNLYIFEAIGTVLDDFMDFVETLDKEVFPQSSTWSLELKEELHGIQPNGRLTQEQRIQNLIEEMNRYQTTTRDALENIINVHISDKSAKIYDVGNYHFIVEVPGDIDRDLCKIIEVVERNKPAHLDYEFLINVITDTYVGGAFEVGNILTIYPSTESRITAMQLIHVGSATHSITTLIIGGRP